MKKNPKKDPSNAHGDEFLDLSFSDYDEEGEACFNVLDEHGVNTLP